MLPAPAAPAGREAVEGAKGRPSTASPGLPEPAPTGGAAAPPRASPSRSPGWLGTWLSPPSCVWPKPQGDRGGRNPSTVGSGGPGCLKRGESGCWHISAVWRQANAKICLKDSYFSPSSFLLKVVTAFTGNEGTQAECDGGCKSGSVCLSWLLARAFQTHQKSSESSSETPQKRAKKQEMGALFTDRKMTERFARGCPASWCQSWK